MKTQTIGTELEFTGITREKAAKVVANYFGTSVSRTGGGYDKYTVADNTGRFWTIMSDSSIQAQDSRQRCELVTPILRWDDIPILQEIIRKLRRAGAKVNESCGLHVHIGANNITPAQVRHLVNTVASREEIFCHIQPTPRDKRAKAIKKPAIIITTGCYIKDCRDFDNLKSLLYN